MLVESQITLPVENIHFDVFSSAAKPFLKWAGGKTQLLDQMSEYFPPELSQGKITKYVEPFIGGGSVFFHIARTYNICESLIIDVNEELYVAYVTIRKDVKALIKRLKQIEQHFFSLDQQEQSLFYYNVRSEFNKYHSLMNYFKFDELWVERTAQIIFLNHTCFNGLFRVNSKGHFNVPFGKYKKPAICNESNLLAVSAILAETEIRHGDFSQCDDFVDNETFVYFDPPYRPISKTSSFTSYSKYDFDDSAQFRLAEFFRHLDARGAKLMLSNSDPKNEDPTDNFFEHAYAGYRIERVRANRMINCNANKRGEINELIIMNY